MQQDIFTNIFLQSDIYTVHRLCQLSKTIDQYLTDYLWQLKFSYDRLNNNDTPTSLTKWLKLYHVERVKKYNFTNYNKYEKEAYLIVHTALVELEIPALNGIYPKCIDIYIKIPIAVKQLIYELLPHQLNFKYFNVITFHLSKYEYKMSLRQLCLKNMAKSSYDESLYVKDKNDVIYHLNYDSLLYYFAVILQFDRYREIVDNQNRTFNYKFLSNSYRFGIMTSLKYLVEHGIHEYN